MQLPFEPPPPQHREALACQYIAEAGLVILIYDHLLSLNDEIEYVWKARWTVPKVLFLLMRYVVPCSLILQTYQLYRGGPKTQETQDTFCQAWFNIAVCLGIVTMAIGNFMVLLRSWVMWNKKRPLILWILALFLATQITVVVCAIIVLIRINPTLGFRRDLGLCIINRRSILGALYAPSIASDGMAVLATCWNALDSQARTRERSLVYYLHHNGFYCVFLLFFMRLTNFLTTLFGPLNAVFPVICFIWSTTTVTFSRLVLDLRRSAQVAKDSELP